MTKPNEERTVDDIVEKIESMNSDLSDGQRAQVGEMVGELVDEKVAAALQQRKYQPNAGDRAFEDTKYARMGLDEVDMQLAHGILLDAQRQGISRRGPSDELHNIVKEIRTRTAESEGGARAMDTVDQSGIIGTQYVRELWDAASAQSRIAALIRSFPMTDKTAVLPVFGAPPIPVAVGESTTDDSADIDAQDSAFANVQVTANKFAIHQKWSGEVEEESIVPFVQALREQQTFAVGFYTDDMIINGDTTVAATGNVNSDDAQLAANDRRVKFDGVRKASLVDATGQGRDVAGAIGYDDLLALRALCISRAHLHDWGHPVNPQDFVYLVNSEGWESINGLTELLTLDKYGELATVIAGQVAAVGMNPLIATLAVPKTEADGKVSATATNNIKHQLVAMNTNAMSIGYLRQVQVETYRRPYRDQNGIVLMWRMGLARYTPDGTAANIAWTASAYNWT